MDFKKITDEIVQKSGGEENIVSLSHCMTRLRFIVKDEKKPDLEGLKSIDGVISAVFGAGQLQVIMGKNLLPAYDMIMKKYRFSGEEGGSMPEKEKKPRTIKSLLLDLINFIAGSVSPMITGLIAGGMLKLMLMIIVMILPSFDKTESYSLINFLADVPFYFMPIFVAYGASRKLGSNPIYAIFVACVLVYPGFVALVENGGTTHIFGLPVLLIKYSSTMIPALLSTVAVYYLEKFFNKIIPGILKSVLVGMLTVLTASILTFVVFGPFGNLIGNIVVGGFLWTQGTIGPVVVGLLAALLPFLVMTGTHTVIAPFMVQSFANPGYDPYFKPALILHAMAEGGAAIGVGLRAKSKTLRSEALAIGFGSIFAGITEPAIYGIALKYKKPLIGVMAGGAVGGIVAGLFGARAYIMGKTTILAMPIFQETLITMLIACIVAIVVSAIVAFILGIDEGEQLKQQNNVTSTPRVSESETQIVSIVDGVSFPLSEVKDEVFSTKAMGEGIAFTAKDNVVVSPCSGVLTTVFKGGHAYGITRDDGVEILIHIGINTVSLKGKGFNIKVQQGQRIQAGEELVTLDLDYLKTTNLDLSVLLIFTDPKEKEIQLLGYGEVLNGQNPVAEIK
ncbi:MULTISPECIES: glucose PTS transporter subunit IIA [unclassified Paenibacillus]|uniref:glucose PTS transporter subunit IIA n=1 Tax=unclassified Paenibacillus TaxID=185978 RepID=UPI000FE21324|nr:MULTISPECIES: glucose PTS transporter subunit IIA [unclassified Paenibacillus]MCM3172256.1 glucose PTS transporter subunit IIA [Paenibacillus sp. MER 99-2]